MSETTLPARQIVAPYITSWSEEDTPSPWLLARRGRLSYVDEVITDRDRHGVLWSRPLLRPGVGRPLFGTVHPLRQRRAMSRLLCQVCAGPADRTEDGVLFVLKDHRQDWLGWPEEMAVTEPPICLVCVRLSARVCPALRRGAVLVRAGRYEVVGVHGELYTGRREVRAVGSVTVSYDNPAAQWVKAQYLVRELWDCTLIELADVDKLVAGGVGPCPS